MEVAEKLGFLGNANELEVILQRNFKSDSIMQCRSSKEKNHKSKVRELCLTASFWTPGSVLSGDSVFEIYGAELIGCKFLSN